MTTGYERPPRTVDRYYAVVSAGLGRIVGVIIVVAIAALLFKTFYGQTPTSPSTTTSNPAVAVPDRSAPKVPTPPSTK
jgi:hypothetical protein